MLQTQSFRASLCEGEDLLPKVIDGIKFTDGDEVMPIVKDETQTAA